MRFKIPENAILKFNLNPLLFLFSDFRSLGAAPRLTALGCRRLVIGGIAHSLVARNVF